MCRLDGATVIGNAAPHLVMVGADVSYVDKLFDPGVYGFIYGLPFDPGVIVAGMLLLSDFMDLILRSLCAGSIDYIFVGFLLYMDTSLCASLHGYIHLLRWGGWGCPFGLCGSPPLVPSAIVSDASVGYSLVPSCSVTAGAIDVRFDTTSLGAGAVRTFGRLRTALLVVGVCLSRYVDMSFVRSLLMRFVDVALNTLAQRHRIDVTQSLHLGNLAFHFPSQIALPNMLLSQWRRRISLLLGLPMTWCLARGLDLSQLPLLLNGNASTTLGGEKGCYAFTCSSHPSVVDDRRGSELTIMCDGSATSRLHPWLTDLVSSHEEFSLLPVFSAAFGDALMGVEDCFELERPDGSYVLSDSFPDHLTVSCPNSEGGGETDPGLLLDMLSAMPNHHEEMLRYRMLLRQEEQLELDARSVPAVSVMRFDAVSVMLFDAVRSVCSLSSVADMPAPVDSASNAVKLVELVERLDSPIGGDGVTVGTDAPLTFGLVSAYVAASALFPHGSPALKWALVRDLDLVAVFLEDYSSAVPTLHLHSVDASVHPSAMPPLDASERPSALPLCTLPSIVDSGLTLRNMILVILHLAVVTGL